MSRYTLFHDMVKAHRTHLLREATRAHPSLTGHSNWASFVKALWGFLA